MKIVDLAVELFEELGNPSDSSVSAIQFWLVSNIGQLNSLINKNYAIDSSAAELTEDLGVNEAAILKKLYLIKTLDSKIREFLGASSVSTVLEVASDGGIVRLTNKNEIAKTYNSMKKDEILELDKLVNAYNYNAATSSGSVLAVYGSDGGNITILDEQKPHQIRRVYNNY